MTALVVRAVCCLSNPQNLNISRLLGDGTLSASPFHRVLCGNPPPSCMIMLANSNTQIHKRKWCVLKAHPASRVAYPQPTHLTTAMHCQL